MQYRYSDGTRDTARWFVHEGVSHPPALLTRKNNEDESAWLARLAAIGMTPVRYEQPEGFDPNTMDKGDPVETLVDGWLVVSWPNVTAKVPVWSTATKERMYISHDAVMPPGYTNIPPLSAICEWNEAQSQWDCCIPENTSVDRNTRDRKLDECQWMVNRHRDQVEMSVSTSLTAQEYADLLAFRQALRDVPGRMEDSRDWTWPTEPVFISYKPLT